MSITFFGSTDQEHETFKGYQYDKPVGDKDERPNFSNSNAKELLGLLDIYDDEEGLCGKMTIGDVQCALAIARATWQDEAIKFTRDEVIEGNFISFGSDENDLRRRLDYLAAYVENVRRLGATHINWA